MFDPRPYRSKFGGGIAICAEIAGNNYDEVKLWVGDGTEWHNGRANYVVGLIFGEYEERIFVPFGWWVVQHGGDGFTFLAPVVFRDEYEERY